MNDDMLLPDELTEEGAYFCANTACPLHVRRGDPGALGLGNWARLPDGTLTGRGRYGGVMLCDLCGRRAAPARPSFQNWGAKMGAIKVLSLRR
jgi:hypothetical protein